MSRLKAIVSQIQLSVTIVKGKSKETDECISFLFVGQKTFPLFLSDLLYNKPPEIKQVGKVFVWRLNHLSRFFPSDMDAVLVSCDGFYRRWLQKEDLFVFPHMVDMVLDVSDSFDVFYKKLPDSAKSDIRKVKKQINTYEVLSDINRLKFFYDKMYLPLYETRFADMPLYKPPFTFFKWLHLIGYRLLLVKDAKGEYVSGSYFRVKGVTVTPRYNGVFDGDVELIRKGAESAIYYFFIFHAQDQNVSKLDFGGARPFFNDGLFFYKRKWGMSVESYGPVKELFGLRVVRERESLKQFLIHNPFIGLNEKNELIGFVFIDKNTFTETLGKQLEKRFQTLGVNEFRFNKL